MMPTGLVILLFIIYHLLHFTFGLVDPKSFKYAIDPKAGDVAEMVIRRISTTADLRLVYPGADRSGITFVARRQQLVAASGTERARL